MIDINTAVRIVDNWRDRCPGQVDGKDLIQIGVQKERRFLKRLFGKKVKHIIYVIKDTKMIWYKNKTCDVGVVKMGFSLKRLGDHPNAVPMEFYYDAFVNPDKLVDTSLFRGQDQQTIKSLSMTNREWLNMNNYELTSI